VCQCIRYANLHHNTPIPLHARQVYLENLGAYYATRYGLDFRSIRYPGIISSEALPGGGTTDYAVEIYHKALAEGKYKCFLKPDAVLPMLHMRDCLKATLALIEADADRLTETTYNVAGLSFSPEEQTESIQKFIPSFTTEYEPDFRQEIGMSVSLFLLLVLRNVGHLPICTQHTQQPPHGLAPSTTLRRARTGTGRLITPWMLCPS
jgi:nucleoside-diphosphate-sugar epimerase